MVVDVIEDAIVIVDVFDDVVVVVDVQPGLDAETGISHPVVVVRTSGCALQRKTFKLKKGLNWFDCFLIDIFLLKKC